MKKKNKITLPGVLTISGLVFFGIGIITGPIMRNFGLAVMFGIIAAILIGIGMSGYLQGPHEADSKNSK